MKKLVLVLLLSISFISYADSTCTWQYGNTYKCKEDRRFEGPDMEKAGIGLRNILRWLNENSTNTQKTNIPANAYSYQNSWKCYDGYKKSGNSCIKKTSNSNYSIPNNAYRTKGTWECLPEYYSRGFGCFNVPANGYASSNTFKCLSGYKKSGNSCIKASVNGYAPSNSYVLSSGEWKCNTGFKKSGNRCIKNYYIPANGYASGNTFKCLTGFKKSGNSCIKSVVVPANGYASGNTFKCLTGFKKSGSQCIKEKSLPANAIAYGDDFKCKYGFFKEYGTSCKKIPTNNAYAYGVTWFCNGGYIKTGNQCLKKEERPENSFLLSNGGWKCKVRYEKIENKCIREQTQVLETDSKNESLEKPAKEVEKQAEFLEKISQAKSLLDSGIISEEEFSNITKRIIEKSQENTSLTTQKLEDEAEIQYRQLLAKEVQDEQDTARSLIIEDQLNTLQNAYINNIAARIKTFWRYQSAESHWTAEVYVVQDRDGNVRAVDVKNANVGNSKLAKSFMDSIERAVNKASPLPGAPDEAVFDKELYFIFSVN